MNKYIIKRRIKTARIKSKMIKDLFEMLCDFEVTLPNPLYAHYVAFTEDEWLRLKSGLFFPKDGNGGEVPSFSPGRNLRKQDRQGQESGEGKESPVEKDSHEHCLSGTPKPDKKGYEWSVKIKPNGGGRG